MNLQRLFTVRTLVLPVFLFDLHSFEGLDCRTSSVPWAKLVANPHEFIEQGIPPASVLKDPSYMTRSDAEGVYDYWLDCQNCGEIPLRFIKHGWHVNKASRNPQIGWVTPNGSDDDDESHRDESAVPSREKNKGKDRQTSEESATLNREKNKGKGKQMSERTDSLSPAEGSPAPATPAECSPALAEGSPAAAEDRLAYLSKLSTYVGYTGALKLLDYVVCPPFCSRIKLLSTLS